MGDPDSNKIYIPHRRKNTIPRRSIRGPMSDSENVEVKKARVFELADEDDDDAMGIEVNEKEGIMDETFSQEDDVNLGGFVVKEKRQLDFDLNFPFHDDESEERIKSERLVQKRKFSNEDDDIEEVFVISSDNEREERDAFDDEGSSVRRYTRKEKGKGKVVCDRNWLSISSDESEGGFRIDSKTDDIDLNVDADDFIMEMRGYSEEGKGKGNLWDNWLSIGRDSNGFDWETSEVDNILLLCEATEVAHSNDLENRKRQALSDVRLRTIMRREDSKRVIRSAAEFAHGKDEKLTESSNKKNEISSIEGDDELEDTTSPFSIALKGMKERNSKLNAREKTLLIKWTPSRKQEHGTLKTHVPSLLDLSIDELAKNADVIVSLEPAPDAVKHKLSRAVCDYWKMNGQFLKLLMSGSPTEVRVHNCSLVTEEDLSEIFQNCDTNKLRVLQLDLCGRCLPDYILSDTLARSLSPFPALATISLRGAGRLSDIGLKALTLLAPSLQSINLGQCSLVTSASINTLSDCFGSILKELYIDYCPDIDAIQSLPALKKFVHLEVLSVAGIPTVSDTFVTELITARGQNLKELVLADCVNLTDISLKIIGNSCNKLCVVDLSKLHRLTDSGIRYLANGCRSIQVLKLSGIGFSDEAIAAVLEVSGSYLKELSLNYVSKVGLNTALSLSKYSRSLLSLDLSWCRKLTDEALGLIVDSCLSLRLLKLFGCSQITELFLNGHSNPSVQIIGLKQLPLLEHLDVLESQEAPLRYSQLIDFTKPQCLNPSGV